MRVFFWLAVFAMTLTTSAHAGVFVFAAGSNNSLDRQAKSLEYASRDAEEFIRSMSRVGNVPQDNMYLAKDTSLTEFTATLTKAQEAITKQLAGQTERTLNKLIFFFSGHADERGFHFRDGYFSRILLDQFLQKIPVKTKVVIVDSCFSGLVSAKGAKSVKGFGVPKLNFDEPTGSIYLTATSNSDLAYESKRLRGGLFSHSIIEGLYGNADTNGDGVVTATELYEYAFRETQFSSNMLPTSNVQKPEFVSNLSGRGSVALSFPAAGKGDIRLTPELQGSMKLYAAKGVTSYEHTKSKGESETISLPDGEYRVQIRDGAAVGTTNLKVRSRSTAYLTAADFQWDDSSTQFASRGTMTKSAVPVATSPQELNLPKAESSVSFGYWWIRNSNDEKKEFIGEAGIHAKLVNWRVTDSTAIGVSGNILGGSVFGHERSATQQGTLDLGWMHPMPGLGKMRGHLGIDLNLGMSWTRYFEDVYVDTYEVRTRENSASGVLSGADIHLNYFDALDFGFVVGANMSQVNYRGKDHNYDSPVASVEGSNQFDRSYVLSIGTYLGIGCTF